MATLAVKRRNPSGRRGEYQIVQGLEIDEFARGKLAATDAELREERAGVATLL